MFLRPTKLGPGVGNGFMQDPWLPVGETAEHLGVDPDRIYKWITPDTMVGHNLGQLWKFFASDVDEWVKAGKAAEDTNAPIGRAHV